MSVNMDVGVRVPAGHFSAAGVEAQAEPIALDRVQGLILGAGATLGVLVSCLLSVLVFLS